MEQGYGEFIVKVIDTLNKNGFPQNQVTLPLEKMYEVAHSKGLNFNKVLEFLREKEKIDHRKTEEKILFFPCLQENSFDPSQIDMNHLNEAMKQAESMDGPMGGMLSKAKEMLANMSPDQMQNMMKMFQNLPDDKKSEIMAKAKDFMKN